MIKLFTQTSSSWRAVLRSNFSSTAALADFLQLSPAQKAELDLSPQFPCSVPLRFAEKMAKGTLDDPLTRQFLPLLEERMRTPEFATDPVKDATFLHAERMLIKYHGRALFITTGACGVHCRFCFRQNFDYPKSTRSFEAELELLRNNISITEAILSGGDPLSLPDRELDTLLQQLAQIPHLQRIRFHTRFCTGIPERIDDSFLSLFNNIDKQVIFVLHANHAREFDKDVWSALRALQNRAIPILLQTVLLKGVNDNATALEELFGGCVDHGVFPYYLHQLDRVQGAQHYEIPSEKGLKLLEEVRQRLPGYAIPQYVQEIAGQPSKTPLTSGQGSGCQAG